MAATEVEYYIYKTSYEEAHKLGYVERDIEPFGYVLGDYNLLQSHREEVYMAEVRRHLKNSGLIVESSKGEYGHGQHELNILYSDLLSMADNHVVYKQCFKETAQQMGYSVTFMPKPHTDQSGSSCHVHMNILDKQGNPAFCGNDDFYGLACSPIFKHFLGGWIKYAPDITVFMAPTINAYKRFRASSWAPTKCAWSLDNRTAGFRIVGEGSKSFRIENRIPGADCNPYLLLGALLGAGNYGIQKQIIPPPKLSGNVYKKGSKGQSLPGTLSDAVTKLRKSKFAVEALGKEFVNHYAHAYAMEVEEFNRNVTDWERKRYFENI
jgi:glutamine synthetase